MSGQRVTPEALIPPQRCAPSQDKLAKAVTSGWVEGFDEFGKYGPQFDSALAARAVLALFGDQPTVTQAKAEAWDEGRESVAADFARPIGENGMRPSTPNPYRSDASVAYSELCSLAPFRVMREGEVPR